MTDLRERFRALDDLGEPPVDVRSRTIRLEVPPSNRGPSGPGRIGIALLALAIAAAGLGLVARSFRSGPPASSPTPPPVVDETVSLRARVPVADFPNQVAVGFGWVWAGAAVNDGSGVGHLLRIDPRSGDIDARVAVPQLPSWEVGTAGIAVGPDALWIAGGHEVTRVDPATLDVRSFDVPVGAFLADIWADGEGVWVLAFGKQEPPMIVARLDAVTGDVLWRSEVGLRWGQDLFRSGDTLWAFGDSGSNRGSIHPDTLIGLQPADGGLLATTTTQCRPAPGPDGRVWLTKDDQLGLFDPVTRAFQAIDLGESVGLCEASIVPDGGDGLWLLFAIEADPHDVHVTPEGVIDRRVSLQGSAPDLWDGQSKAYDPATDTFWFAQYERFVVGVAIEPSGG
jgi:hypothetical protein